MFQSENDLIPRCAPKPSASDATAVGFHPSVPEISIVFAQKDSGQLTCSPPTMVTSYSVWKNKCVPRVVFPPEVESFNTEFTPTTKRSKMYPLGTGTVLVPYMNYTAGQIANKTDMAKQNIESSLQAPYSDSETPKFCSKCVVTSSYSKIDENSGQQKQSKPFLLKTVEENFLTNSAGTQTDNLFINANESHNISSLATKEDIAEIKSMIFEMERGHRHLLKTLQNLVEEKLKLTSLERKPELRDVGTQVGEQIIEGYLIQKPAHIKYDSIDEDLSVKEDYDSQHKTNIQTSKAQRTCSAIMTRIPKIATEQSIVMNQLAVKYLPNGNLNGMLEEVLTGTKVQNEYELPLKNVEKLDKNPTDLSTASYKYLTKYRLLPCNNLPKLNTEDQQENLLDLEKIRCKPKFI